MMAVSTASTAIRFWHSVLALRSKLLFLVADVAILALLTHSIAALSPFLHTDPPSWSGSLYVGLRIVYIAYLAVLQLSAGHLLLKLFRIDSRLPAGTINCLLVNFVCGAAALRVLMFFLGLAGALHYELIFAIAIGLLLNAGAYSPMRNLFSATRYHVTRASIFQTQVLCAVVLSLLIFAVWVRLGALATNGDYLSHYGQYLLISAQTGQIDVNDVWYHFYFSKGDAFSIAAIVLTDAAAKMDVSTTYFLASLVALHQILTLNKLSRTFIFIALALTCYVLIADDVGTLAKHHIGVFFAAIAMVHSLVAASRTQIKYYAFPYYVAAACAAVTVCLAVMVASIFPLGILGAFCLWSAAHRRWSDFFAAAAAGLFLCGMIAALAIFNYHMTGLYEISPTRFFLDHADLAKMKQWVSPYLTLYLEQGSSTSLGELGVDWPSFFSGALDVLRWPFISTALTLPLACLGVILFCLYSCLTPKTQTQRLTLALIFATLVTCLITFLISGHPVSAARATIFIAPFTVMVVVLGLAFLGKFFEHRRAETIAYRSAIIGVICFATFATFNLDRYAKAGLDYVIGRLTVDEYYHATNLISPGTTVAVDIRRKFGPDVRILGLQLVANELGRGYLMGNGLKTEVSYALGPEWHRIAFGNAAEALRLLKQQTDIVLIDLQSLGIGAIPYSPLMSPDSLRTRFKVVFAEKEWLALAPLDSPLAGRPLSESEMDDWQEARDEAPFTALARRMQAIYDFNHGSTDDIVIPPNLPVAQGWQ